MLVGIVPGNLELAHGVVVASLVVVDEAFVLMTAPDGIRRVIVLRRVGRAEVLERVVRPVEAVVGAAAQVVGIGARVACHLAVPNERRQLIDGLRVFTALDVAHAAVEDLAVIVIRLEPRAELALLQSVGLLVLLQELLVLLLEGVALLLQFLDLVLLGQHGLEVDVVGVDLCRQVDGVLPCLARKFRHGILLDDLEHGARDHLDVILCQLHVLGARITLDVDAGLLDSGAHGLLPRRIARDLRRIVVAHDVDARRLDDLRRRFSRTHTARPDTDSRHQHETGSP